MSRPATKAPRWAAAAFAAGLSMLAATLLAGCGQSPSAAAQGAAPAPPPTAAPAAPASPPTTASEPPAATAQAAAPPATPADAAPLTAAPELLEAAHAILIAKGCVGCHTIAAFPEAQGIIGPNLSHINSEAARVMATQLYKESKGEATTTREFIRESILKPSAYICQECEGGPCPDHVMPKDFKSRLTPEELETLLDVFVTFE